MSALFNPLTINVYAKEIEREVLRDHSSSVKRRKRRAQVMPYVQRYMMDNYGVRDERIKNLVYVSRDPLLASVFLPKLRKAAAEMKNEKRKEKREKRRCRREAVNGDSEH